MTSKLEIIKSALPNDSSSDDKKMSLTQKMKLVFPELSKMNKIPMSVKSHYLGTRAQVKAGERELTWTGLTLDELTEMTVRLRERGRQQYQKLKEAGGRPFGVGPVESAPKEPEPKPTTKSKKRKVEEPQSAAFTEAKVAAPIKRARSKAGKENKRSQVKAYDELQRQIEALEKENKAARASSEKHVVSNSESDSDEESCDDSEDNLSS